MIARRHVYAVLPCLFAGALLVTEEACSSSEAPPPLPTSTSGSSASRFAAADRALRHDVAYAAVAAARCSEPGSGRDCAKKAAADVRTLAPKTVRVQGLVSDILAQLPIKPVICAIVRSRSGSGTTGGGDSSDGGTIETPDAADGGNADAGAATDLFDVWGGLAKTEAVSDAADASDAGDGATNAPVDVAVVYDTRRCQSAAFVHPRGGIPALVPPETSYRAAATGPADGVIQAWSGSYVLDGEATLPTRVKKVESPLEAMLTSASAMGGMPVVSAAFLASIAGRNAYVPWDQGTEAILSLPTGVAPTGAGEAGARYVQYAADRESGTTCGAQMAVAMLNQAGDEGDFQSSAGNGALTAIATGIALSLGIEIDAWCGDVPTSGSTSSGGTSGSPSDESLGGQKCLYEVNSSNLCKNGLSCTWNGDEYCCRSEPKGTDYCNSDGECQERHDQGWVCSNRRRLADESGERSVCTPKETCR